MDFAKLLEDGVKPWGYSLDQIQSANIAIAGIDKIVKKNDLGRILGLIDLNDTRNLYFNAHTENSNFLLYNSRAFSHFFVGLDPKSDEPSSWDILQRNLGSFVSDNYHQFRILTGYLDLKTNGNSQVADVVSYFYSVFSEVGAFDILGFGPKSYELLVNKLSNFGIIMPKVKSVSGVHYLYNPLPAAN